MMTTAQKNAIRQALLGMADNVRISKDGTTITAKRTYYFTHGMTTEKFAAAVLYAVTKAGVAGAVTEHRNVYQPWPRDSYFIATFTVQQ